MFVAAMNPCPCENLRHREKSVLVNHYQIKKYQSRISGHLMNRIGVHIDVSVLRFSELSTLKDIYETPARIRKRVMNAREIQNARFTLTDIHVNAQNAIKRNKKILYLR